MELSGRRAYLPMTAAAAAEIPAKKLEEFVYSKGRQVLCTGKEEDRSGKEAHKTAGEHDADVTIERRVHIFSF